MIELELLKVEFCADNLYLTFLALCTKCDRDLVWRLQILKLTNLFIGCTHCDSINYPSLTVPLHSLLISTLRDVWNYSQDDIDLIERKLKSYQ